jgi:hypothetical protein
MWSDEVREAQLCLLPCVAGRVRRAEQIESKRLDSGPLRLLGRLSPAGLGLL